MLALVLEKKELIDLIERMNESERIRVAKEESVCCCVTCLLVSGLLI